MIKDSKGMALPLVLITMFVLTILGTSLWQYSITDTIHVARDQRKMQAHYLARSGAEMIANHILRNPEEAAGLIGASKSAPVILEEGSFEVEVYGVLNDEIIIESTGRVGDINQTVVLTILNTGIFGDFALFASSISLSGNAARIYGDVVFTDEDGDDFKESIIKEGEIIHDPHRYYPPAEFPEGLPPRDDIHMTSSGVTEYVYEHGEYDSIVTRGGTLNFELNGDLNIYAHTFEASGNGEVTLTGSGRLLLFTDNYLGGGNFTMNPDPDSNVSLVVFVSPGGLFNMNGTPNFSGAVYAPEATVHFSGVTTLTGSVIADDITGGGKITVIYEDINSDGLPINTFTMGTWQWKE